MRRPEATAIANSFSPHIPGKHRPVRADSSTCRLTCVARRRPSANPARLSAVTNLEQAQARLTTLDSP
jgi:hypothetical protein